MSTAIQKPNTPAPKTASALSLLASRLNIDPAKLLEVMKSTVFQKASDNEIAALTMVCNEYGLNPFLKEIYAFPAKGGGIVPIVSVDGWNKMLVNHPDFDGIKFTETNTTEGELYSVTATVFLKNRSHPVEITEYLSECKRNTEPWNTMPRRMLRNRVVCQSARMAFGFSGVHHEDEAQAITVEATVMPTEPPPKVISMPSSTTTPQTELEALVTAEGYTFDHLQKFGVESGNITNAESVASFAEIPADEAKRMLRAKTGLLTALKAIKEAK